MTGKRAKRWTERRAVRDVQRGLDWYDGPTVIRERGESLWVRPGVGTYTSVNREEPGDVLVRELGDTVRVEGTVRGDKYRGEGAQRYAVSPGLMPLTEFALTLFENGARA